jgi:hypothetical protein
VTKVVSIRVPQPLADEVRKTAKNKRTSVSALVAWVLNISLVDGLDLSRIPDAREPLDCKLDLRLSEDLFHQLHPVCEGLRVSISVYVRTILYGGYTQRLAIKKEGGRYKLVHNHD